MRLTPILALWLKDVRESFRDRKTLFMSLFLPVLLYPLLILGSLQLATQQMDELESRVVKVQWVGLSQDEPLAVELFADDADPTFEHELVSEEDQAQAALRARQVDVVVIAEPLHASGQGAPDSARAPIELDAAAGFPTRTFQISYVSVLETSSSALPSVEELLWQHARERLVARIEYMELPESFASPLAVERDDRAGSQERGGMLIASLLPLLLLVSILSGALYPAIDLTAGERERGTIQTLFTAPVSSLEILASKFLAVFSVALLTGLANLISLGLVTSYAATAAADQWAEIEVSFSFGAIMLLLAVILQLAIYASATLIGAAALARSTKEAQLYTMPIYMGSLMPAAWAQMPGVVLNAKTILVPGANIVLMLREGLVHGPVLSDVLLVTAANLGFATFAVFIGSRIFSREGLIVSQAAPFRLLTGRAHLLPSLKPGPGEALAATGVLFIAFIYIGSQLQLQHPLYGLMATIWLVILAPTLGAAWWWKLDMRTTFALRAAPWTSWVGAALLGISLWVPVALLSTWLEPFVGTMPEHAVAEFEQLLSRPDGVLGMMLIVFTVAITPAIGEEALFRGFLLQGLRQRGSKWGPIVVSAIIFGLFHLLLPRVLTTSLLGVALGWLVIRSGSIGPAILLHALNNSAALFIAWGFADLDEDKLPWGALMAAAAILIGLGLFLVSRTKFDFDADAELAEKRLAAEDGSP